MNEQYKNMMKGAKLSGEARAAIEEKLAAAAAPAPHAKMRPMRVALIAACVCLVLAGTAFAADALLKLNVQQLDTSPVDGSPVNGFTTVVEYECDVVTVYPEGEPTEGNTKVNLLNEAELPVRKLLPEQFSEEVLALAAQTAEGSYKFTDLSFTSFAAAEEYIGLEIFDNPLLESCPQGMIYTDKGNYDVHTQVLANSGELMSVFVESAYFANYHKLVDGGFVPASDWLDDTTYVPVNVQLRVQLFTRLSPIAVNEMFGGYGFPEGYTFSSEEYVSPKGLKAVIISVYDTSGGISYFAQCGINGAAVTLEAVFPPKSEVALETLKSIIDAFEY